MYTHMLNCFFSWFILPLSPNPDLALLAFTANWSPFSLSETAPHSFFRGGTEERAIMVPPGWRLAVWGEAGVRTLQEESWQIQGRLSDPEKWDNLWLAIYFLKSSTSLPEDWLRRQINQRVHHPISLCDVFFPHDLWAISSNQRSESSETEYPHAVAVNE